MQYQSRVAKCSLLMFRAMLTDPKLFFCSEPCSPIRSAMYCRCPKRIQRRSNPVTSAEASWENTLRIHLSQIRVRQQSKWINQYVVIIGVVRAIFFLGKCLFYSIFSNIINLVIPWILLYLPPCRDVKLLYVPIFTLRPCYLLFLPVSYFSSLQGFGCIQSFAMIITYMCHTENCYQEFIFKWNVTMILAI